MPVPRMSVWYAAIAVIALLGVSTASAKDYYVAPNGNDADPGTLQQPFATLHRARQAVRAARPAGEPIAVHLRGGTHYLREPLVLDPDDSGAKTAPVVFQSYPGEKAVISGGVRLDKLQWKPFRGGIVQAAVPAGFATDQLFVNGRRQPMARYPNFDPDQPVYNGYAADAISPERSKRWADPRGGFIHAMHASEWGGFHYLITGKKPDGTLAYEGGWQNNRPAPMHGRYRFVENIFEELDAPGEWFLDGKAGVLYYYPPRGVDLAAATIEGVRLKHLVELRGSAQAPVRFITFKGLQFRHTARTFMENKEPLLRSDWTTYRGGAIFCTGSEDCSLEDCFLDQVGGNAIFVNNYNRRLTVRGCHIAGAGANGVAFVGDRAAARVPQNWNDRSQSFQSLDRTPGPKTENYPADCLVDDCLIYQSGRVEKQTAPVQIELSQGITVRHCSLYDVPRAGINIGDGCWGGHVIEHCDIFDTVQETGDHGSFNSWGRDRFWGLSGLDLNDDKTWEAESDLPRLDAVKTVVIHDNRWRCDHGWDIDLDDGSTNYHIYNNLCLHGGLKNREGFYRVVENNIIVDSGFHPHVWYKHSQDIFRRNIVWSEGYLPAGGMPSTPWGNEMDRNLVHRPGAAPRPAARMASQSRRDAHSIVADAMFVDPAAGDYRVKDGSPALGLGFVNFPMDQFGVQKPELKAIARVPQLPGPAEFSATHNAPVAAPQYAWQARVRDIAGLGDRSAYGLPSEHGVLIEKVPADSPAAKAGLRSDDVILGCNSKPVRTIDDLRRIQSDAAGAKLSLSLFRKQQTLSLDLGDYAYAVVECRATPDFQTVRLAPAGERLSAKIAAGPETKNEPLSALADGKVVKGYGPVFGNGVRSGRYKLDLGAAKSIVEVRTFSFNQNGNRGRQRFILYGSNAASDPGWNTDDERAFIPIFDLDSRPAGADFVATSIRQSNGKPLGNYRWLVWAVRPISDAAGGENTAFQEIQVIGEGLR